MQCLGRMHLALLMPIKPIVLGHFFYFFSLHFPIKKIVKNENPCRPNGFRTLDLLEADFKNNQTTKQLNKFIWTNRKQVKFCFYLPIGLRKFVLSV